jgi:hypothetical protein
MLDQAQLHNRKIDWSIILKTAIKAEKLFGVPQTPMPFNPSGTAITTLFSSTFLPVDNPVQHDPSIIDISLDHNSQHKAYTDPAIISMPATNQQIRKNNPRPVAANVPRPVQKQNMPNIAQPEPVAQEVRPRDPSPAPHVPRAEEPIDNHQDQFFSPVEDEIHSPYRRSQRLASLPRINYDETALARAAVSRSAGNDQTPTTSRKGSMKKTMKEIRKSLTTALNAILTTPLTPSRSPSPTPRQPLPVRSRPQTERNNSPKLQQYNQSSNRSTDHSPSRIPDQNNRYRNISRYQPRSPSPGRNNNRMQDRPRDNRYSPQNSRPYPRQQSQSPNRSYSDRDRTSSQYRQSRRDYTPPRNQS